MCCCIYKWKWQWGGVSWGDNICYFVEMWKFTSYYREWKEIIDQKYNGIKKVNIFSESLFSLGDFSWILQLAGLNSN